MRGEEGREVGGEGREAGGEAEREGGREGGGREGGGREGGGREGGGRERGTDTVNKGRYGGRVWQDPNTPVHRYNHCVHVAVQLQTVFQYTCTCMIVHVYMYKLCVWNSIWNALMLHLALMAHLIWHHKLQHCSRGAHTNKHLGTCLSCTCRYMYNYFFFLHVLSCTCK